MWKRGEAPSKEDDIWFILGYASVHQWTVESACRELARAPSANRFREVLKAALPSRSDLQRRLNTLLRAQLPRVLLKGKRRCSLALEATRVLYHGQPE